MPMEAAARDDHNSGDRSSNWSRRAFLQSAAVGGAWLAGGSLPAAEPPVRDGKPYMKLSLAAYSFNRQLKRNWPRPSGNGEMTLYEFIDFCAEMNLAGTELTSYYFPEDITPEYLLSLKERTFRQGLDISGTAIGNDFCVPEGARRDRELEITRRWIDYAAVIGAPAIRIFAGHVPEGESEDSARERCVSAINEMVAYASTKGVILGLENHGGITATPQQMLAIIEQVDESPWFGVTFDSGNFRTDDPYRDMEMIAPYAVTAQVKVAIAPNNGPKEPADLARVVKILKDANYRGYLVLEYEEPENPFEEVPKYLDQLRELIA